jgi:pimeloyl-ACP methyl ester carboxylesterase
MRTSISFLVFSLALGCAHVNHVDGLHIDDGGSGNAVPVLFVHGNGANLTQWRAQLDHLRPSRRAIAFDLRGMGQSAPAANGDYSVKAMANDVAAVADALKLKRFVIVGHSFGGAVVAQYVATHPDRVAGVVYADAAGNVKIGDEQAAKFLAALRKDKEKFVRAWFAPILKNSPPEVQKAIFESEDKTPADVIAAALDGMRAIDMRALLDAYHGPRLAIAAADIESPSSLHVEFPDVPVRKISGTGHWLMMDKPDEFNRILDEFLAGIH